MKKITISFNYRNDTYRSYRPIPITLVLTLDTSNKNRNRHHEEEFSPTLKFENAPAMLKYLKTLETTY